ncbi:MAG: integration host factor subunit beta [Proteobacteria bacterium]|nr:integration host factor subunit beta [Pseudomonadota bacterium]MBU4372586.1 integration host factor subunit beta [Pseudomonadota bacterium]MBU4581706.1 integration host factor subunit beta [Pseudomonadota bacterium]
MNKSDLIAALAAKENLTEKQATDTINLIFNGFTDALKKGGRNEIRGFGSFSVRQYDGYTGRNPKTGAKTDVGAKKLPFFKVGKGLKARLND